MNNKKECAGCNSRKKIITVFLIFLLILISVSFIVSSVSSEETNIVSINTTLENVSDNNGADTNPAGGLLPDTDDISGGIEKAKNNFDAAGKDAKAAVGVNDSGLWGSVKTFLSKIKETIWDNGIDKYIVTPIFTFLEEKLGFNVTDFVFGENQILFASALGFWICVFVLIYVFVQTRNLKNPITLRKLIRSQIFYIIFWIVLFLSSYIFKIINRIKYLNSVIVTLIGIYLIFVLILAFTNKGFFNGSTLGRVRLAFTALAPAIYLLLNFIPILNRFLQIITFEFVGIYKRTWIVAPFYACLIVFGPIFWARYKEYRIRKYQYNKAYERAAIYEASKLK